MRACIVSIVTLEIAHLPAAINAYSPELHASSRGWVRDGRYTVRVGSSLEVRHSKSF
jgi:hypothetical protein